MVFLWLMLYGTVRLLTGYFSALSPWMIPLGLLITTVALALCEIRRQRTFLSFRQLAAVPGKRWLQIIPFFLPAIGNLACFGIPAHSPPVVLSCFLAAAQEELLFRGVLLLRLREKSVNTGVILSGLAFAAAHFLNVERSADLGYTLYQAVFALSAGFALSALVLSFHSLLPGIVIHFAINITAGSEARLSAVSLILLWLSILLYFVCGIVMLRENFRNKEGCFHETVH